MMRHYKKLKKYYTVKEWNRFQNNNYFDMQEMLCKKYEIILTDYKTKKEKICSTISKINLENFDKGIVQLNKIMQSFTKSIEQFTDEFDNTQESNNTKSIWGKSTKSSSLWNQSKNNIPIWSSQTNHESNMEKIWGKKN
ncbi:hypothetical protein SCCGRSA3_02041 [Marine Group I thaumarchaeote SCGC RSA3]|uniref:Uncharacterized protein n=2 Tax=Marine Group I TaxID=905826 RepID=A0A081RMX9_9ARCH|nr:hypothetical protein AAA799N04_01044 [Marine Group I thaumarchaeote SCGC AAA799-N04]KFM16838.1 hypothetical protein SCCGRSA3_02041 [Marine Group I thaumarchaeote SCGC RSA3]